MEDRDRPHSDQSGKDSPAKDRPAANSAKGGGVARPLSATGPTSSDPGFSPDPDSPTLVDFRPASDSDSPTLVDYRPPAGADSPTLVDVPTPPRRATASINAFGQAVLQPGMVLGQRYEVIKMLGEGGMGAVYKARDRELNRMVALKVIRPEMAANPAIIQRFKQELILARQVTHKNVIRIYDLGEADGLKFITMDYIEGEDLFSLVKQKGKLPPDEAVDLMLQVCRALDAAHNEGVIHRDLKPQNIMVDQQGRVLVMDFGLARSMESDGMTRSGALVGTVEYMSPEQALGEELDQRSDLFALGLILYELLTGKLPFKAESMMGSLLKRTKERAIPAADLDSSVPRGLSNIVSKCLERERTLRYQNVQQMLTDLDSWKANKRTSVSSFGLLGGRLRFLPWKLIAAGVAAVLVVAGVSSYLSRGRGAPVLQHPPVSVLVADFKNSTSDSVFDGTLEPAFGLALEGASFIETFNRGEAHKVAAQLKPGTTAIDENLARLVATREGIGVVVSGSIAPDGSGYKLSSRALDSATGKALAEEDIHVSSKDDVLRSVGKLAAKIRSALGDQTSESSQLAKLETYSSGSLEAAHEYATGQDLQAFGKWEEAFTHYQRAIELDPNMGRAYAGLGTLSANMGRRQEAERFYQQAMARIDRMGDREKFRTRGGYFLMVREPREAIQEYNALVQKYPADSAAYSNIALAYFYLRNMPKAMQEGRRAVEVSPKSLIERNNLALYAVYAGDFATGEKEARAVLEQNPSYALAYGALAMAQVGQQKYQDAAESYHQLEALSTHGASMAKMGLADLALAQGDVDAAVSILEQGIEADVREKDQSAAAAKQIALAQAHLAAGRKPQALSAAEKAIKFDDGASVLHAAGMIAVDAGQPGRALALATQLGSRVEPEPQLYSDLLQGYVALARGNTKDAVVALKAAQAMSDTWLGRFLLGRAYLETQSFPEADAELENSLQRRGEAAALYLDDVPTFRLLPQVHYYLGRAQEGLNSPAAAESYRTFLALNTKGIGPLVTDAHRRLDRR